MTGALDRESWRAASPRRRRALARAIAAALGAPWTVARDGSLRWRDLPFAIVPGGRFECGLTAANRATLEAILARGRRHDELWEAADDAGEDAEAAIARAGLDRHAFVDTGILASMLDELATARSRTVELAAFLLARAPLSRVAATALGVTPTSFAADAPVAHVPPGAVPALLAATGLRLPSEAEWEWAARGGTGTLWWGGDEAPLERELHAPGAHPFGLAAIGHWRERCADGWHVRLERAPRDGRPWPGKGFAVRGGAAAASPWQGCNEWLMLVPSMRQRGDARAAAWGDAIRLARSIPTLGPATAAR
ncbi:MAG: SUMF1/EgtB/PvdO family nonheme iron enzyme [Kofleriaceae bacterium]|nr:SUMF1/EgtB/PvdO family nonheme iron enzyme [Kofleriaceae bacterium]MCL4223546.1 SUMF1/EgtB/PvdO family nonheme iron enzyme [Myxococcales bacterium]